MMTLRERLRVVMAVWHATDEFNPAEEECYLDDLETAVKDWLNATKQERQ